MGSEKLCRYCHYQHLRFAMIEVISRSMNPERNLHLGVPCRRKGGEWRGKKKKCSDLERLSGSLKWLRYLGTVGHGEFWTNWNSCLDSGPDLGVKKGGGGVAHPCIGGDIDQEPGEANRPRNVLWGFYRITGLVAGQCVVLHCT